MENNILNHFDGLIFNASDFFIPATSAIIHVDLDDLH